MKFCIVPFAIVALTSGCLSIPGKASENGSLTCVFPQPGGNSFCQEATSLTAKEVTSQTSLCTSMQGTVVDVCPAGAVGCCATTSGNTDFNKCFYGVNATTQASTCATNNGVWTAGSETSDAGATE